MVRFSTVVKRAAFGGRGLGLEDGGGEKRLMGIPNAVPGIPYEEDGRA